MIELVARKASTGQVDINRARMYLERHEWGLARMALEDGLSKGGLHDIGEVEDLLRDIHSRLHGGPEPRARSSASLDSMVSGI